MAFRMRDSFGKLSTALLACGIAVGAFFPVACSNETLPPSTIDLKKSIAQQEADEAASNAATKKGRGKVAKGRIVEGKSIKGRLGAGAPSE